MYYRVATQRRGDQLDRPPSWQWKSTVLSSLQTLFQFLRPYGALQLEGLRVFSSSSRDGLEQQLMQENEGFELPSVTAAHFLQERLIHSTEGRQGKPECEGGAYQEMAAMAVASQPLVNESSREVHGSVGRGMSSLERRRLELELGPGGDHDVPYQFSLPCSLPQVLAWTRLLAKVHCGALQPL